MSATAILQRPTQQHDESLMLDYLQRVSPMLRHYAASTGLELDDLEQEALICIMRCHVRKPNQPGYIMQSVRNLITDKQRKQSLIKRRFAFSLDCFFEEDSEHSSSASLDLPDPDSLEPLSVLIFKENLAEFEGWLGTHRGKAARKNGITHKTYSAYLRHTHRRKEKEGAR